MRESQVNYAKWEKSYTLKVAPEVLTEAVQKGTGKLTFLTPINFMSALWKRDEGLFISRTEGDGLTVQKGSSYSQVGWPKIRATLRHEGNDWKLDAYVECSFWLPRAILAMVLLFIGLSAALSAYHARYSPSLSSPPDDATWILWILGPVIAFAVTYAFQGAMRYEAEVLVCFFEKLVAPYALAADTMDRNADARDH
ncbi:MAG: hypothetical protein L6R28_06810 [Planctomycetes bacterium]|nr:hypothetical protein [Planctomycetota bacterium]